MFVTSCSYSDAHFAVKTWHYTASYPAGVSQRYGVYENERFIGALLFSTGPNRNIGKPFQLDQLEVRELVRVALADHITPVSQILAQAVERLNADMPSVRLVVSYADPAHGHHGGIYQACNWLYIGDAGLRKHFVINGKRYHPRQAFDVFGTNSVPKLVAQGHHVETINAVLKHKYVLALDAQIRRRVRKLALPYPPAVQGLQVSRLSA